VSSTGARWPYRCGRQLRRRRARRNRHRSTRRRNEKPRRASRSALRLAWHYQAGTGGLGRIKPGRNQIAIDYPVGHDLENVGHRRIPSAERLTFRDIASGLISEEICGLQSNGALLVGKIQLANDRTRSSVAASARAAMRNSLPTLAGLQGGRGIAFRIDLKAIAMFGGSWRPQKSSSINPLAKPEIDGVSASTK
jgi:hypothetical protein